jgi:hypothetical protein
MKKVILFSFFITALSSCDPPHDIHFANSAEEDIKLKIVLGEKTIEFGDKIPNGDSIVFNIKKGEIKTLYFGIGTWSEEEVKQVSREIKTLVMSTDGIKITYNGSNSIENLLMNNRKGWRDGWQTDIEIDVGDYLEKCQ